MQFYMISVQEEGSSSASSPSVSPKERVKPNNRISKEFSQIQKQVPPRSIKQGYLRKLKTMIDKEEQKVNVKEKKDKDSPTDFITKITQGEKSPRQTKEEEEKQ